MRFSNVTPNARHDFTSDTTLNIILQEETKDKEENHTKKGDLETVKC